MATIYRVNVYFGAEPMARATEDFSNEDEAIAFGVFYQPYNGVRAVVFAGSEMEPEMEWRRLAAYGDW